MAESAEEPIPQEITELWCDMDERRQRFVVAAHCIAFKTKKTQTLYRIFNLGNPKIVIGLQYDKAYCRVHEDSVEIMELLITSYLK